jgi:hypothetical protein
LILLVALGWRLHNIGFGLPSMYDPDEPIFMITALRMLVDGTLNPGWFGHPGSTTITLVAAIDATVAALGIASGRYADVADFSRAAYADPALLFVPARIAMALIGTLCVWLTYRIGRRLHGTATGLVAAALLAVNSLHIAWSQVIRTDINASAFMLACLLFATRFAEQRRLGDLLIAGAFAGLATSTKWPGATVFIAVIGSFIFARQRERLPSWWLPASAAAALTALFIASPYLFLDWHTVIANVGGEVKTGHLAHNGGGLFANMAYYLGDPVASSMGMVGLALAIGGLAWSAVRSPIARWTMLPATLLFLGLICTQHIIWSRWVLPVLPMLAIGAGFAVVSIARRLANRYAIAALALAVGTAPLMAAVGQARERANDTRSQAAAWASANIPPGSRVVFEHLELSLRDRPWTILFPIGSAGCVDGVALLAGGVDFDEVQSLRGSSPIIDLGNVAPARIDTCRGDYAILAYHDLYLAEAARYPAEIATYRRLLAGGRTIALFRPQPGRSGGPVVRIVALPKRGPEAVEGMRRVGN